MPRTIAQVTPSSRAAHTARWATTMTRWAIRYASTGKLGEGAADSS